MWTTLLLLYGCMGSVIAGSLILAAVLSGRIAKSFVEVNANRPRQSGGMVDADGVFGD